MAAVGARSTTPAEALATLDRVLDLGNIRMKLSDSEEGPGLTEDELDLREAEYRKFLALRLAFPDDEIVPCKLVDEMWHRHILDTRAYAADCEAIFGYFLHHFPYFGMRGPDDAQALRDAYTDTLDTYRRWFGDPPEDTWVSKNSSRCRTQCKPQKCK